MEREEGGEEESCMWRAGGMRPAEWEHEQGIFINLPVIELPLSSASVPMNRLAAADLPKLAQTYLA